MKAKKTSTLLALALVLLIQKIYISHHQIKNRDRESRQIISKTFEEKNKKKRKEERVV